MIFRVDHDFRMFYRVFLYLVDPGIQGNDILDLLSQLSNVMKFDGIGTSTEDGVSGLKWLSNFKHVEELLEFCIVFDVLVRHALPLDLEMVALLLEKIMSLEHGFVKLLAGYNLCGIWDICLN